MNFIQQRNKAGDLLCANISKTNYPLVIVNLEKKQTILSWYT